MYYRGAAVARHIASYLGKLYRIAPDKSEKHGSPVGQETKR